MERIKIEIINEFPQCYEPYKPNGDEYKRVIAGFLDNLSLRDFVLNDAIIDKFGQQLDWKPIIAEDWRGSKERPAVSERRWSQFWADQGLAPNEMAYAKGLGDGNLYIVAEDSPGSGPTLSRSDSG